METQVPAHIVPENLTGKAVDLEETVTASSPEEAANIYTRACKRLQNPPLWQQLSGGALSASFELVEAAGNEAHRLLQLHDYLRISIPGPGTDNGDGYDWVQVKAISDNTGLDADESFGLTVAAARNPAQPQKGVAHFFKEGASSSFAVRRTGNKITASYHGRNERPNTNTGSVTDALRNTAVATGALIGLSEMQWSALIKGLLQEEIGA